MRFRPDSPASPRPAAERRGVAFWRAVRYCVAVFAGYLLGLAAGALGPNEGPSWWLIASVGALALLLIFRQGKRSQQHAYADAAAAAVAQARAQAVAQNTVNVAQGHIVQGGPVGSLSVAEDRPAVEAHRFDDGTFGFLERSADGTAVVYTAEAFAHRSASTSSLDTTADDTPR